jgi:ribosomal protein L7/L12
MSDIHELEERVAKLERTVEYLMRHLNVEFKDWSKDTIDPEVLYLVQQGNVIEAIKRYREMTGVGLAEAKRYVDQLR